MFTGIVEGLAGVASVKKADDTTRLCVDLGGFCEGTRIGDSVSVNGVCLTVSRIEGTKACFDLMRETLKRTTLGELKEGDKVNVERAMKLSDRQGGHFVLGHVDFVGTLREKRVEKKTSTIIIDAPKDMVSQIVPKGSVSIDGISLTVINVGEDWLSIGLIPHTLDITTLGFRNKGDHVNVEIDYLAKLVKKLIQK